MSKLSRTNFPTDLVEALSSFEGIDRARFFFDFRLTAAESVLGVDPALVESEPVYKKMLNFFLKRLSQYIGILLDGGLAGGFE